MDKDFVYHMFMSSLKKHNCEPLTKESTSLLMKEVDQMAKTDGDIGSPKSPENVARAFLHTVKGRNFGTPKKTASGSSPSSRRLVACKVPDIVDAPNGHASCSFAENNASATPSFIKSPLLSRCRRKLRLDLKYQQVQTSSASEIQQHLNNYRLLDAAAANRTPELRLSPVVACGSTTAPIRSDDDVDDQRCHPNRHLSLPSVASTSADAKDEHLLIAFNSALLHVKPNNNLSTTHMDSIATAACSKTSAVSPVNSIKSEHPTTNNNKHEAGTSTEPSPDTTTLASTPATESFHRLHNRLCTSYRVKVSEMKNPVDVCLLPNDYLAVADYDNGLLILNSVGEVVEHRHSTRELNACGVASTQRQYKLFLLVFRDGSWLVNVYNNFELVDTLACPHDAQIENWAIRRLSVVSETMIYLMASGERKSCIWRMDVTTREWRLAVTEGPKFGTFNDMSVRCRNEMGETRFILCDWRKAKLWTLTMNEKFELIDNKTTKMKRVKGQEWIVQGPTLAALDEQFDILVYDGSGKIFLFDGETYKYKKIVADVGRGEVSSVIVRDGWLYALCRYRLSIEAYMYKEYTETHV